MSEDAELLHRFVTENSEDAFRELVEQHLGFVYHTALRHLDGDPHAAEDVAQGVFADLARKAGSLANRPALAGWLYTSTRYAALQRRRSDRRRAHREQEAHQMQAMIQDNDSPLDRLQLQPVIDDALGALGAGEREAVFLRCIEELSFVDIGHRLNLSADGARSRVERALDKMRVRLGRRGITCTVAALSATLTASAAPAPTGLSAAIVLHALQTSAEKATSILSVLTLMKASSILLTASLLANVVLSGMYSLEARPTGGASSASEIAPSFKEAFVSRVQQRAEARPAAVSTIDFSDPYAVGRLLQDAGFPGKVVAFGIRMAVSRNYRAPGVVDLADLRRERGQPWNQDPMLDPIASQSRETPEEARQRTLVRTEMTNAVLAAFELDSDGNSVGQSGGTTANETAAALREIEAKYDQALSATLTDRMARDRLELERESAIEAILPPDEAAEYFFENSSVVQAMRKDLSELDLPRETLMALAAEVLADNRAIRNSRISGTPYPTENRLNLVRRYREILGDEAFTHTMNELDEFEEVDAIYQAANLTPATRADRYLATLQFMTNTMPAARGNREMLVPPAATLREVLIAGLNPGQVEEFESTELGGGITQISGRGR